MAVFSFAPFALSKMRSLGKLRHSFGQIRGDIALPGNDPRHESGMSLLEILVVFFMISVLTSSAVSNLAQIKNPLKDGISQTLGFVKEVRAKALASTAAYTLRPASTGRIVTTTAATCSAVVTTDGGLAIDLPSGVVLSDTSWTICFTSRGLTEGAQSFTITDADSDTETIEVFLGGAVRIRP